MQFIQQALAAIDGQRADSGDCRRGLR